MSDSAALRAWRHRARGAGDNQHVRILHRLPPKTVVFTVVAFAIGCAFLGAHARTASHATQARVAPPPCRAVTTELHADVDGDGCDEEVTFADGVLTAGPVRVRVGAPGDQVALGRWSCAAVNLALLRPATGEVFAFDSWATRANSVSAVVIGRVEGADAVHAAARADGRCDDIVVSRASGPPVLLPDRTVAG